MDSVKAQQWLIGIFSVLLIVILIIVAGYEMKKSRVYEPEIEIDEVTGQCINCHTDKGIAVKLIEEWHASRHAEIGIGCNECHHAEEGEFDAMRCPESDLVIGRHPTPGDCAECHAEQVAEHTNSKHAVGQVMMALKGPDRNVFEPTISTKNGCEQCHNIGNYWPDGTIGECDACHSKHRFDPAQARRAEVCGECHVGPDHPHIEIYMESKHGNMYAAFGYEWDWDYTPGEEPPFSAPTCATCHMSATRTGKRFTHNVSERLSWESQAPFSVRTQNFWGGIPWQEKRKRMEGVCQQCHSNNFIMRYLLTADLCNLQYNEIWEETQYWANLLKKNGVIETDVFTFGDVQLTNWPKEGYDEEIEHTIYRNWHHEGRRFRHGAQMMGADYTQWHGIWEIQENLAKIIQLAAEHNIPEAKQWLESDNPNKFMMYPQYDMPGNAWGPTSLAYRGNMPMDRIFNYWEVVTGNVETAYKKGLLMDEQWEFYRHLVDNMKTELGRAYELPEIHDVFMKNLSIDLKELYPQQKVDLKGFEIEK
ncbi:MAG: multiheme c-type cytochrome [Calditrichia bacterium]